MAFGEFAARLRAGTPQFVAWCATGDAIVAESLARAGYDGVCIDLQHGLCDETAFGAAVAGIGLAGAAAIARSGYGAGHEIGRLLDRGAEAVIVPMIDTPEDARRAVAVGRFPPVGQRSWGPQRLRMLNGLEGRAMLEAADAQQMLLAMIETRAATANAAAIAAVEGIDGLFVGPNDLSISLSAGTAVDPASPAVEDALAAIAAACRDSAKVAGIFANSTALAARYRAMGFALIACGTDLGMIGQGAAATLATLRG